MPNLATALIGLERFLSGMRRRVIQVEPLHRIVYSEGGRGETVLLLHGFGASGDSWNRLAAKLTKNYRVIAPDLPGWGASTRLESSSYGYPFQLQRLHGFVQKLKLERFHLAGHSMGGFLAAAYAAQHRDSVITLGLVAPHGMTEPQPSDLARSIAQGDNWLVPTSLEDFRRLLDNLFVKRPYIPGPVIKYLGRLAVQNSVKNQKIFNEIQGNAVPLIQRLPQIQAPAMIVWGDQDRVIHVSCAALFQANLRQAEVLILKDCGHMPLTEKLRDWAGPYAAFVGKGGSQAAPQASAAN